MNVDASRMVALDPQCSREGRMGSIPVHFAWSRDLYQSAAAVTFTVNAEKNCWRWQQAQELRMAGKASEPL